MCQNFQRYHYFYFLIGSATTRAAPSPYTYKILHFANKITFSFVYKMEEVTVVACHRGDLVLQISLWKLSLVERNKEEVRQIISSYYTIPFPRFVENKEIKGRVEHDLSFLKSFSESPLLSFLAFSTDYVSHLRGFEKESAHMNVAILLCSKDEFYKYLFFFYARCLYNREYVELRRFLLDRYYLQKLPRVSTLDKNPSLPTLRRCEWYREIHQTAKQILIKKETNTVEVIDISKLEEELKSFYIYLDKCTNI